MSSPNVNNGPEKSLPVKLMDSYIEQVDRVSPSIVKLAEDCSRVSLATVGAARKTVLDAVERSGCKPPFINTATDLYASAMAVALALECRIAEAGIAAHRQAAVALRDALSGKRSA